MIRLRVLAAKFFGYFRRRSLEQELAAELESHLEMHIEDNLRAGMSPAEARRLALVKLGGVESIREQVREVQRFDFLETTLGDLAYGLRRLRRNKGFAVTAILTLSLTTGALATVLTLAHTLFFKPLPVPDADKLVKITPTREFGRSFGLISYPDYARIRDATQTLEDLAAHYPTAPLFARLGERAETIEGSVVTANFFPLLRLQPALGRFFLPTEDRVPDRDRVAVLSYDFWSSWFGASPEALGGEIELNGVSFTIIGIAPRNFQGLGTTPVSIYVPMMMLRTGYRWCVDALSASCTILRMIGRRAEGRDLAVVQAEMDTLVPESWQRALPDENSGLEARLPQGREAGATEENFVSLLAWVAGILLLACCANLSGLLVARAGNRAHELSVRASIGASKWRLIRQLLTESQLLALGGGLAGILLSLGLVEMLNREFFSWDSGGRVQNYDFSIPIPALLAVLLVSVGAGLVFGLVPALRSIRLGMNALGPGSRTVTPDSKLAPRLVVMQAIVATLLVIVAGLLASSARELVTGTNFEPSGVALLRLRPRLLGYSPEQAQSYLRKVLERLRAVPGVESFSFVGTGVALRGLDEEVALPGVEKGGIQVGYIEVGPRYFETIGTPLLKGREFLARDGTDAPPVAIVSRALANLCWPGSDPLGRPVRIGGQERTVVGIVADAGLQSRAEGVLPFAFVPFWQNPASVDARLQVRVAGDPATFLPTLIREIHQADPQVPITETLPLATQIAGEFRTLRMSSAAVSYAALVAVLLSTLGLYGSLSLAVARRRREIGIRMAIGASSRSILRLFQGQGLKLVGCGVLFGLLLAVPGTRLLRHLLYGSPAADIYAFLFAAAVLIGVGILASHLPALRASRIAPSESLKE